MGWGSSTRRGGGRKLRALPRKFIFLGFRREEFGIFWEFCRDVPDLWGCPKSFCKKKFVLIFRSLVEKTQPAKRCRCFWKMFATPPTCYRSLSGPSARSVPGVSLGVSLGPRSVQKVSRECPCTIRFAHPFANSQRYSEGFAEGGRDLENPNLLK